MADPQPVIYLTAGEAERFHEQIMLRAGQSTALLRDRGLLESAVLRPQTAAYYEGADLITQAALYMVGIALNHAFFDGNKRTGYMSGMTFLRLNGVTQRDPRLNDPEMGAWLEQVVGRQLDFAAFVERLRSDRLGLSAFPPLQTGQAPFNASGFPVRSPDCLAAGWRLVRSSQGAPVIVPTDHCHLLSLVHPLSHRSEDFPWQTFTLS